MCPELLSQQRSVPGHTPGWAWREAPPSRGAQEVHVAARHVGSHAALQGRSLELPENADMDPKRGWGRPGIYIFSRVI